MNVIAPEYVGKKEIIFIICFDLKLQSKYANAYLPVCVFACLFAFLSKDSNFFTNSIQSILQSLSFSVVSCVCTM